MRYDSIYDTLKLIDCTPDFKTQHKFPDWEHYTPSSNAPPLANLHPPIVFYHSYSSTPHLLPEMTVTHHGNRHDECESNDVPVNKITTFNGRLNQYFHTSKNVATSSSSSSGKSTIATTPETCSDDSKRKQSSQEPESDVVSGNGSESRPKRRKAVATNPSMRETLPARITRSRSASSTPSSSPASLVSTCSQSTTTKRTPRIPRQPAPPASSHQSLLRDTIPPNLTLLLVGVNPGVLTGTTGFAYAHPSNLFWKLLHWSGITTIRHPPSDTYRLPELYNIGNTNIVERPTRDASMLSRAEMDAGVPVLEAKVAAQRPEVVCLVGKSIWEAVWRVRRGRGIRKEEFRYGWQDAEENMGKGDDGWPGAPVFVATTTSGLAAGMSMAEKQAVWDQLGNWVVKRREERGKSVG